MTDARHLRSRVPATVLVGLWCLGAALPAQQTAIPTAPPATRTRTEALSRRVDDRVRALQAEADALAGQAKTLLGELRQLEVERDLEVEHARTADAEARRAGEALAATEARLSTLERQRVAELPDLHAGLVELYKQGRGGYTRMLFSAQSLREVGRTARAVAALARLNTERAEAHRRTIEALRHERLTAEQTHQDLQVADAAARKARAAAERAVTARAALIADTDRRRDLNAQLVGELQVAQQKLAETVANLRAGRTAEVVALPIGPFRGALDWPASGRVTTRFGAPQADGSNGTRPGIDVAAAEGAPVRAIHPGTVSYAEPFEGFGTLVILDHGGGAVSLYGYLGSATVTRDRHVEAGEQLGTVGLAPAGPAALYFELRIDGRPVNPVQWLKSR